VFNAGKRLCLGLVLRTHCLFAVSLGVGID
jgi:hypothetical protein